MLDPGVSEKEWGISATSGRALEKPGGAVVARPSTANGVPAMIAIHTHPITRSVGDVDIEPTQALIEVGASAGYRQMFACMDGDNVASLSLRETHGIRRVGLLEAVGFKHGKWADSVLMQRAIGPGSAAPPVEIAYSRTT